MGNSVMVFMVPPLLVVGIHSFLNNIKSGLHESRTHGLDPSIFFDHRHVYLEYSILYLEYSLRPHQLRFRLRREIEDIRSGGKKPALSLTVRSKTASVDAGGG
jgi:hypothetical protein